MFPSTRSLSSRLLIFSKCSHLRHNVLLTRTRLEFSTLSRSYFVSSTKQPQRFTGTRQRTVTFSRQYTSIEPKRNEPPEPEKKERELRENIYTITNALTVSRILSCPVLGWAIVQGKFGLATGILVYAGVSDWVSLIRSYALLHDPYDA